MSHLSLVRSTVLALAALFGASAASPALAQTVNIEIVKAGFIFGVSGGGGTLNYAGRRYPLRIGGVSLGATIGASKANLTGRVYNLRRPSDINGVYRATQAGYAVLTGRRAARLVNSRGVVLELRGRQVGLEFDLDLSGLDISLR